MNSLSDNKKDVILRTRNNASERTARRRDVKCVYIPVKNSQIFIPVKEQPEEFLVKSMFIPVKEQPEEFRLRVCLYQ